MPSIVPSVSCMVILVMVVFFERIEGLGLTVNVYSDWVMECLKETRKGVLSTINQQYTATRD